LGGLVGRFGESSRRRVATTTDVYMQTMKGGVRSTVTSIDEELMATSTAGQHPAGTRGIQGDKNFSAGEATLKGGNVKIASSERKEPAITHPVRGKVLEFATKPGRKTVYKLLI
jgi:hypothetical protein